MSRCVPTIGLEVHAELKTKTKMFCNSQNDSDETRPNVNICSVCMGHPGTLPAANKEAVRLVRKVGVAVGGTLADGTFFSRKNYFYPDIPKGYQISQYGRPLIEGGALRGVPLTRIHLEEDTGISVHDRGDHSLLDFNRAGVPLLELVTEPALHSAKDASAFARELQLLLRALGASNARMEKGEMRVEANVSVALPNNKQRALGTKVEVKNLNSFKAVERAIEYEIERQSALLEKGESVAQETRGWDDEKGETYAQRKKEASHDYRYFPEPDIPPLRMSAITVCSAAALKKELPELPSEKRARYEVIGLSRTTAEFLVVNPLMGEFYDTASAMLEQSEKLLAANYLTSDVAGLCARATTDDFGKLTPDFFAELMRMIAKAEVSSRAGKDILAKVFLQGGSPRAIAESEGLLQQNDAGALMATAKKVAAEHQSAVADYKAGKETALQFLVGQGMKEMKGTGNPTGLREAFKKALERA